jgi:alpha/beta superfamily hydrolase
MAAERVRFPAAGENSPTLQGELWLPDSGDQVAGVVVAHPHPQRGGSMDSNVVMAICQGLYSAGIAFMRFNFRGVGGSEGRYGEGIDEANDIRGALSFLAEQPRIDSARIALAGYSFGARVSLGVAPTADIRALFCVAPPLSQPIAPENAPRCPYLVFVGDQDGNVRNGVDAYASCLPHPDRLRIVQGTDHFWQGYEQVLVDASQQFFAEHLATTAPQPTPS